MVLLKREQVINMSLKFDKRGLANELLKNFEKELQWVLQAWENEVIKYMRFAEFQKNADVDFELKKQSNAIIAYLKVNTYVLADSYGTGSLMLIDNPGFQEYKKTWHEDRKSTRIVGRKSSYPGTYTDVLGHKRTTSGSMKGKNLEGVTLNTGYQIQPVAPSRAVEIAEGWLYKTYLPKAYSNAIKNTNFAKYLIES